ncbi:MAG TPA: hypothetical protein QF753_08400 [Victivallales bacterium]|nr:hypothetical protein [Victivallales bacterium]|tara:strand:+ start:431 stop:1072 length:642 start_codon:yes stop_codon:yes gene_type:complete
MSKKINEILLKLARINEDASEEMAEGIDGLFLDSIHLRAFIQSIEAVNNRDFSKSFLCLSLGAGTTYAVIMKICKLYDRAKDYKLNSLREVWKKAPLKDKKESELITKEFDTGNENSIFKSIIRYRDKVLAHNEQNFSISWQEIDKTLSFFSRVWFLVGQHSESAIMFPFYDFKNVSGCFDKLFSNQEIREANTAWNNYINSIKLSMQKEYNS